MQNALTIPGHAPAVRASRALTRFDVRKAYTRAIAFLRRKAVTLAAISTAALYAGILIGSYPIICTASLAALGFVALADSTPKGGEA